MIIWVNDRTNVVLEGETIQIRQLKWNSDTKFDSIFINKEDFRQFVEKLKEEELI